jgi:cytoskeletal protein RodZ
VRLRRPFKNLFLLLAACALLTSSLLSQQAAKHRDVIAEVLEMPAPKSREWAEELRREVRAPQGPQKSSRSATNSASPSAVKSASVGTTAKRN